MTGRTAPNCLGYSCKFFRQCGEVPLGLRAGKQWELLTACCRLGSYLGNGRTLRARRRDATTRRAVLTAPASGPSFFTLSRKGPRPKFCPPGNLASGIAPVSPRRLRSHLLYGSPENSGHPKVPRGGCCRP